MKIWKRFFLSALSLTLAFFIFTFIFFPLPGYVPVLMYHFLFPKADVISGSSLNVGIEDFQKQMWFLRTFGYRTISLDEYYEIRMGRRKPRGKEVLITFDDGHHTYLEHALPVLERYQLKSVNFLVWRHLVSNWEANMNLKEAKELTKNPLVELEAHSMTHPNLTKVSLSRAESEIFQSKDYLQKALNREIKYFCYPEGGFNPEVMALVEKAGYRLAFRTSQKLRAYPDSPYSVVRIKISPKYNLFVFWLTVSGLAYYAKRIDHFFHQLTLGFGNGKLNPYKPSYGTM